MAMSFPDLYGFASSKRFPAHPESKSREEAKPEENKPDDVVTLGSRRASWVTDGIAIAQFTGSGFLYKEAAKSAAAHQEKTPPLSDAPVVKLTDPFLIAPGWTTKPEKFDGLLAHLLKNKENGTRPVYLKEGQAYTDKDCSEPTEIQESDKVFVAVYDDVLSPPDKTAGQLDQAMEMIKAVQGDKLDVLGYSLGGIAVRKLLDEKLETADQVAFLGVGHQGTRFAALAKYVVQRDIKFALKLANINASHLPAMEWMMPVEANDPSNKLAELNANLDRQRAQVTEMVNIGSDGFGTITRPWGGVEGGDGLVQKSSLNLEGVPTILVHGRGNKQHGNLPSDTDAFVEMMNYFHWTPQAT
jgi:hypothetical protein